MKLYVIRHGQTNWNLKGIIQGQKDIELNDITESLPALVSILSMVLT